MKKEKQYNYQYMINCRKPYIKYVIPIFLVILICQVIRKNLVFPDKEFVYDPNVHEFVPSDIRRFVFKSSSKYTIDDLLNLTNITEEFSSNSYQNPVQLVTQWYSESNRRRRQELISVLHMNVINTAITNIHFIQNEKKCTIFDDIEIDPTFPIDLLKQKLIIHYNEKNNSEHQRLTINEALSYANRFITNGYAVFINLDIFFDRSLSLLRNRALLDRNTVLYLSRYEVDPSITTLGLQCSKKHYVGSHDALIFQPPLTENLAKKFPHEMGTWHIEVKMISELLQANYIVRNPCKSIRVWHLHSSQIRHRLMPSKKYVSDGQLGRLFRYPELL